MLLIVAHFNGPLNGTVMFLMGGAAPVMLLIEEHCNYPPMNEWYRNVPNRGVPSPIMLLIGAHCNYPPPPHE